MDDRTSSTCNCLDCRAARCQQVHGPKYSEVQIHKDLQSQLPCESSFDSQPCEAVRTTWWQPPAMQEDPRQEVCMKMLEASSCIPPGTSYTPRIALGHPGRVTLSGPSQGCQTHNAKISQLCQWPVVVSSEASWGASPKRCQPPQSALRTASGHRGRTCGTCTRKTSMILL